MTGTVNVTLHFALKPCLKLVDTSIESTMKHLKIREKNIIINTVK